MSERNGTAEKGLSRRRAITSGAGAALAIGVLAAQPAGRSSAQIVRTGGGVAGGGQVLTDKVRAHFSIFATRFTGESIKEPVVVGKFQWVDTRGVTTIISKTVTAYGPITGASKNARELSGTALLNDNTKDEHPLVVRIADEGGPGSRKDTIAVFLGKPGAKDATTDPLYTFTGVLDNGDIELVDFDLPF